MLEKSDTPFFVPRNPFINITMANDPRLFTVKPCPVQNQARGNEAGRKKSFLDNLLKVGELEVLNDVGLGDVGEGLRVLTSVSDAIRTGQSAVPGREGNETYNSTLGKIVGTARDAVTEGANVVLEATGLDGVADAVSNFNPAVANRAYGQAEAIYDRVKQGKFELSDIPGVFQDLQNLEILGRGIFGGGKPTAPQKELCGATPYARDLIAYAPKFKFLFIVEVKLAPEYEAWTDFANEMAFVVKTSSRPRFEVEYEEVNMYNFRTRVPKRVEYPAITMSFYDDNKNAAHHFYTAYMRAMSPIANVYTTNPQSGMYEQNGMNFAQGPSSQTFRDGDPTTAGHSASLGPLLGTTTSLIQEIRLYHIYDYGNKMNTYNFYNPRIQSFSPSDLSQLETGEGTDFEFEFMYDGVYIQPNVDLEIDNGKLLELTSRYGMRPIDPVYADSSGGSTSTSSNSMPSSQNAEEGAPGTSFLAGIENVAGGITDAFGNIVGGVSDAAEGLLDGVTGQIGSFIPDDLRKFGANAQNGLASARNVVSGAVDGATGAASQLAGQVKNVTSGLTGAMNQNMSAAQKAIGGLGNTASNAFTKVKNFGGSFFS